MKDVESIERACYCFSSNIFIRIDLSRKLYCRKQIRREISNDELHHDNKRFSFWFILRLDNSLHSMNLCNDKRK